VNTLISSLLQPQQGFGHHYRQWLATAFSGLFHILAVVLVVMSAWTFFDGLMHPGDSLITVAIRSINSLVIALAMYELGVGVGKEYRGAEEGDNIIQNIRRTIARFVSTVCIALVLEALIMIIKYSQLDLAGNLYYPVAIIAGCAFLLLSLGGFLALTHNMGLSDEERGRA